MKKMIITTIAAGMAAALSASAEVGTTFDFASAYVFRGYTFNDGAVFQPGLEVSGFGLDERCGSLILGAWGNYNFDDYNNNGFSSQFSEIDWYASYGLPTLVHGLDLSIGYTEYTYPLGGVADKEVNVGAGCEAAGFSLGATVYKLVGGDYVGDTWFEGSIGYGVDVAEDVAVGISADARFVDSRDGKSGFNDYAVGADVSFSLNRVWSVAASATYIGQGDNEVLVDGAGAYDVDFVGTLSLAASF